MAGDITNIGSFSMQNSQSSQRGYSPNPLQAGIQDTFISAAELGLTGKTSLFDIGSIFGKPDANKAVIEDAFKSAEEAIAKSSDSDLQKSSSTIMKDLFGKIGEYAKATGKKAEEVASDVKGYALSHPAVSITVLLATGVTLGVLLEKFNVPSTLVNGAAKSLSAIQEQIKNHPFIAAGIGVALAGTVAYLVNLVLTSPAMKHPPADTPEKQKLDASLDVLEQKAAQSLIGDPKTEAGSISEKFFSTVSEYARAAGKTTSEAAEDIKAFMMAHPGVTAAVILAAGTTTGIVLEKAGVPDSLALLAGTAFDAASAKTKSGLSGLVNLIKDNPVITSVVVSAIAAGAAYLAYEYLSGR